MRNIVINPQANKIGVRSIEAINMLRGNIQMAGFNHKAVSITSASPNEGKSYIAFHLAQSMAALGKKAIFVDCDIRNSVIEKVYKITDEIPGLSEFLCGLCSLEDVLCSTNIENFHVIFSGKNAPNPSELLSSEMFSKLINLLRTRYDYIILDTPPANAVVDATIVSKQADTTVLVVKSCSTDRRDAVMMKKQLESAGVKLLGVVLNMYDVSSTRYGKYGYGKYGYGYGYGK